MRAYGCVCTRPNHACARLHMHQTHLLLFVHKTHLLLYVHKTHLLLFVHKTHLSAATG